MGGCIIRAVVQLFVFGFTKALQIKHLFKSTVGHKSN